MDITITASGGLAGRGRAPMRVATADLPEAMRTRARALFAPKVLAPLGIAEGAGPTQPDRMTYEVRVVDAKGHAQTFRVPEQAMTAEQLDLIDDLMARDPPKAAPSEPTTAPHVLQDELDRAQTALERIREAAAGPQPRWNVAYRAAQNLKSIADDLVDKARTAMEKKN